MATDEFDSAGGPYVDIKDYLGELILFTPYQYIDEYVTIHGTKDAVVTEMVALSRGCVEHKEVRILQSRLIGLLKQKIPGNRKILGRLVMGEARKGQNAPYTLAAPTDEDKQLARDFLAGRIVAAATEHNVDQDDPFAVKA